MPLEDAVGACVMGALAAYAVTGGADFGAGVWGLLGRGPRGERRRELVARAIAPIWEADHVWLIAAIVMLFMGLPRAFAEVTTWLHLPLMLMLLGIVLRGSAFVFRGYGQRSSRRLWTAVFSAASVVTPFMLGVIAGALAAGRLPPPGAAPTSRAFLDPWLSRFPLAVGALAVALFAFLAAVYLCVEAAEEDLREDFRARALGAGALSVALAWAAFALARAEAPSLAANLWGSWWSAFFHLATAAAACGAYAALWRRRYRAARPLAAAHVALVVLGWGFAQHPHAVPPHLTLAQAAAPPAALRALLLAAAGGLLVVAPAFAWLLAVFKRGLPEPPTR